MARKKYVVTLDAEERVELQRWCHLVKVRHES